MVSRFSRGSRSSRNIRGNSGRGVRSSRAASKSRGRASGRGAGRGQTIRIVVEQPTPRDNGITIGDDGTLVTARPVRKVKARL